MKPAPPSVFLLGSNSLVERVRVPATGPRAPVDPADTPHPSILRPLPPIANSEATSATPAAPFREEPIPDLTDQLEWWNTPGPPADEDPFADPPPPPAWDGLQRVVSVTSAASAAVAGTISAFVTGASASLKRAEARLRAPPTPQAAGRKARTLLLAHPALVNQRHVVTVPDGIDAAETARFIAGGWGAHHGAHASLSIVVRNGAVDEVVVGIEPLTVTPLMVVGDDEMKAGLFDPETDVVFIGRGLERPEGAGANDIWVPDSRLTWSRRIAEVRWSGRDEEWVLDFWPGASEALVARVVAGEGPTVVVPGMPRRVRPGTRIRFFEPGTQHSLDLAFVRFGAGPARTSTNT